ncbi:MAG: hypothetical protein GYA15_12785 [Leptolinea sp.]|jgi:hypothetical protein|nr:hypothetical protein [Leptolinea sp.]
MKKAVLNRSLIVPLFILQLVPLVVFTPESYAMTTQEWWLPLLLAVLSIFATFELLIRHNPESWPWYLLAFSQGFNIISRLMMLMPHTTAIVEQNQVFNTPYVIIAVICIAVSWFFLWYLEQPEIRMNVMNTAK